MVEQREAGDLGRDVGLSLGSACHGASSRRIGIAPLRQAGVIEHDLDVREGAGERRGVRHLMPVHLGIEQQVVSLEQA